MTKATVVISGVGFRETGGGATGPHNTNPYTAASIKVNIGAAVALELARAGFDIAIVARTRNKLERLVSGLRAAAPRVRVMHAAIDLLDELQVQRFASEIDCDGVALVHSVGLSSGDYALPHDNPYLPVEELRAEMVEAEANVVLRSLLFLVQSFRQRLCDYAPSKVVVVSSMSGVRAFPLGFSHAAAKGALHNAVRSLALEFAERGVYVSEVAPGIVDTGLYDSAVVQNAVVQIGEAFGRRYAANDLPKMPVAAVAQAVRLCLESDAHILNVQMVARGQWPHAGA